MAEGSHISPKLPHHGAPFSRFIPSFAVAGMRCCDTLNPQVTRRIFQIDSLNQLQRLLPLSPVTVTSASDGKRQVGCPVPKASQHLRIRHQRLVFQPLPQTHQPQQKIPANRVGYRCWRRAVTRVQDGQAKSKWRTCGAKGLRPQRCPRHHTTPHQE